MTTVQKLIKELEKQGMTEAANLVKQRTTQKDQQAIAKQLHTLLCVKDHGGDSVEDFHKYGREPDVCYYYLEEQFEECWDMEDHQDWLHLASLIDCTGVKQWGTVRDIVDLLKKAESIAKNAPGLYQIIVSYLNVSGPTVSKNHP